MFIKETKLLLVLLTLVSCSNTKKQIIIQEPTIAVYDESALRYDFETKVGGKVYFAFDSAKLSGDANNLLSKQADWLMIHPYTTATIEGHCDEQGSREYNLELGLRRAEAAKQALITNGIKSSRLKIVSYGKDRPAVEGHNIKAWKLNRRTVTNVTVNLD